MIECEWERKHGKNIPCQKWDKCLGKDYYTLEDIQYCPNQVQWIIFHLIKYETGLFTGSDEWPLGEESGYTDGIRVQPSSHAYFEKIRQITADITSRLSKTGNDGRLLVLEIQNEVYELSQDAKNVLYYISGWRKKRLLYPEWKKQRKYRSKVEVK